MGYDLNGEWVDDGSDGLTEAQREGIAAVQRGEQPNPNIQGSPQTQLQAQPQLKPEPDFGNPADPVAVQLPTYNPPPVQKLDLDFGNPLDPNAIKYTVQPTPQDVTDFKDLQSKGQVPLTAKLTDVSYGVGNSISFNFKVESDNLLDDAPSQSLMQNIKDYFNPVYNQSQLKQMYEADKLWENDLFGKLLNLKGTMPEWYQRAFALTRVIYDKDKNEYFSLVQGVVDNKGSGTVTLLQRIPKFNQVIPKLATISPKEEGMTEEQFARLLQARIIDNKITPEQFKMFEIIRQYTIPAKVEQVNIVKVVKPDISTASKFREIGYIKPNETVTISTVKPLNPYVPINQPTTVQQFFVSPAIIDAIAKNPIKVRDAIEQLSKSDQSAIYKAMGKDLADALKFDYIEAVEIADNQIKNGYPNFNPYPTYPSTQTIPQPQTTTTITGKTDTHGKTQTQGKTDTQGKTETIGKLDTYSKTETKTQPQTQQQQKTQQQEKTQTQTGTGTGTGQPPPPTTPKPPPPIPHIDKKKVKDIAELNLTPAEIKSIRAWKQGFIYILQWMPYTRKQTIFSKQPIAGIKYATGKGSPQLSLVATGEQPSSTFKMGIADIQFKNQGLNKRPQMVFKRSNKANRKPVNRQSSIGILKW